MKLVSPKVITKIKTLGQRKQYSLRHIQTLIEIEGYQRPSLAFIYKILGYKNNRGIKKIV